MSWYNNLKLWLIKALGGSVVPVLEERWLQYPQPEHIAVDKPLDLQDWGKVADLGRVCPPLFQWIAAGLAKIDNQESQITIGPDGDRARVVAATERRMLLQFMRLPTLGANQVAALLNHQEKQKKGLSNYGR